MYSSRVDFFFFSYVRSRSQVWRNYLKDMEKASRLTKVEKVFCESFGGICFEQNIRFVIGSVGK